MATVNSRMFVRALIGAVLLAAYASVAPPRSSAMGKPGVTPVPCPQQEWQLGDESVCGTKPTLISTAAKSALAKNGHAIDRRSVEIRPL